MDAFLKLFDAFIDIIVGKVYDRINERILKVENDVKTLHDAGSALLSLNLDDDGFKAKMSDFVQNEVGLWYENQGPEALWSEREIDARIDMALSNACFDREGIERLVSQAMDDCVSEAIGEHLNDKEHFDYRTDFDEAVKYNVREYLNDENIDDTIRELRESVERLEQRVGPADVATRSQLKALLIAAAGMVDSVNAPQAQEGGK